MSRWGRAGRRQMRGRMRATVLCAVAPLLLCSASAVAETLAEQQAALANARAQAAEAARRADGLERRAAGAREAAGQARDRAAAVAARIQQAEGDLRAAQARIAILDTLQRRQRQRLAVRQAPIARLTAALQLLARRPPALALLQPGSIRDAVHMRILLAAALPVIQQRTAALRAEIARSRALRADADMARAALARSRDALTTRRSELAALEGRKSVEARRFQSAAALETERALAMGEDARDIVDLMQRMEAAGAVRSALIDLPGPLLRPARPGTGPLPGPRPVAAAGASPTYRLPVVGDVVTGFGELADSGVRSRGLTIATEPGATVVAPADGRIAFAGPFRDFGQIVIIDHGSGWTTLLARLRRLTVTVGEPVRQGDPLGMAGQDKPQIVLELRRQDRPIDIAALIR